MPVTKDWIERQRAEIEKMEQQALAQLNALTGAKQMLAVVAAELAAPVPDPPAG